MRFASAAAREYANNFCLYDVPMSYATGYDLRFRKCDLELFVKESSFDDEMMNNYDYLMGHDSWSSETNESDEELPFKEDTLVPIAKRQCVRHSFRTIKRNINDICDTLETLCVKMQKVA